MLTKPSKHKLLPSIATEILFALKEFGDLLPHDFESPYAHLRRISSTYPRYRYNEIVKGLDKKGFLKITSKSDKRFVQLTPKGNIEVLIKKAGITKTSNKWDGKWRIIIFDIPEISKDLRNHLRFLLKKNNFYKLQHSVFIHPHFLNREAIDYLKETGLMDYIRILRVDAIDDDTLLKKRFHL